MNLLLEGDDLEALLLRAHREGGTAARIVRAEKVRRGGVLGFFAKEGFEVAVEIPKDPEAAHAAMRQLTDSAAPGSSSTTLSPSTLSPVSFVPTEFPQVRLPQARRPTTLGEARAPLVATNRALVSPETESPWNRLLRWRPGSRKRRAEDFADHIIGPAEIAKRGKIAAAAEAAQRKTTEALRAGGRLVEGETRRGPRAVATSFAAAATFGNVPAGPAAIASVDRLTADRQALLALGVPALWSESLPAGDRFGSIVAMLGRLPEPMIRADAAVIAVIGPAESVELEAHRTTSDLSARGWPRAITLVQGAMGLDRRVALARSKRVRPVVISVPVEGYDNPARARKILTKIKAEVVIVVLDASRPLAEITSWVRSLEQVDAIALEGALDVENPAAVLGLDIPVIRVDGITVDRWGWAALLCAQLVALDSRRTQWSQ